ncbi:MAG: FliA/WhiG family RNA polymerase sigma factor [Agathobaculum sp.]|uniref:sigma-70 family RNA polymerase sigma factor n=1 Tax=Agathobaculum sp. TaxID=2048138 RepID=UPI0025BC13A4|nr:FliA/WhiG family RNA polymerase sigma factor [Agathobaculum sp.]MCI7124693.1 FliA/WhiG family RNA polymerase sigma factor [Agathobaculum sp.]MDY3712281.1 FliA/WhiG family RNA polymerase sigma factor [Agathobaculum sp.]
MTEQKKWEDMSNEMLLKEYKETNDQELKKVLVMRYVYLVKNIALKLRGVYLSFAQVDDIINEGVLLLMSALDKFDPGQNVKFETFVCKRLRGMIIDLARKQDWVPRSVRRRMHEIDEAYNELFAQLGRTPTDSEVAKRMGMSEARYQEAISKTALCNVISLDMMLDERESETLGHRLPQTDPEAQPEEFFQRKEMGEVLRSSIRELRENEQLVLSLYYQKSLQMKEIAKVLGVSEPRVSQIHSNAIRKLRIRMTAYMNGA